MNQAELNALNTAIHNDAKLLYCIGIRALANEHHQYTLDYKKLIGLLNGKEHNYQRGRQINQLVDQFYSLLFPQLKIFHLKIQYEQMF